MNIDAGDYERVTFEKDQPLFIEGGSIDYFYIIVSGRVRIIKESSGRVLSLALLGDKAFVGEAAVFGDVGKRIASAVAETSTELIRIPAGDIKKVLSVTPEWVRNIMKTLSQRLQHTNDIIAEHKIKDETGGTYNYLSEEEEAHYLKILKI
ncbi:MAG: Crp/Fnr family transcriptional regulator [Bacteriovoracaceae bacterium]|jgi:CRP-like cAMP-binding protein|nr:Crp/Fnr family transcriptional regulator [Bacteriovoracaceae bacterium]